MAVSPGGRPADASPLGKKGGPRGLSDYTREIAHALMRRGVPKSKAIAIARASEAKRFSHSKNPAIAAAAIAAVAQDHVLDHRKRGHSMSRAFDVGGSSIVDLDWSDWNAQHQGQDQQPDLLTPQAHNNIAAFQKAHGLPATGQIDPKTTAWLNDPANSTAAHAAATKTATAAASTAKKAAAAQTKTAKAATAAAKKAAAAQSKAAKKAATDAAAQGKKNQAAATKAGKAAVSAGAPVRPRTASLSTPIVSSQDGARMSFGGKKATPFTKGSAPRKAIDPAKLRAMKIAKIKRMKAAK